MNSTEIDYRAIRDKAAKTKREWWDYTSIIEIWRIALYIVGTFGCAPFYSVYEKQGIYRYLFYYLIGWLATVLIMEPVLYVYKRKNKLAIDKFNKADRELCPRCKGYLTGGKICRACQKVIQIEINENIPFVAGLIDEAEKRIKLTKRLGLSKQSSGVKQWFMDSLPGIVKEKINLLVLEEMRKEFPNARKFHPSPRQWEKHKIDSSDPSVNIPSEGLINLKKLISLINQ